jgi:hypothetical protein
MPYRRTTSFCTLDEARQALRSFAECYRLRIHGQDSDSGTLSYTPYGGETQQVAYRWRIEAAAAPAW